jgi:precorrin-2 methylase
MRRIDFLEASSMREQAHIACEELRNPDGMRITFDAVASFLSLTRQAVFNHLHCPFTLNPSAAPSAHEMISAMIIEHFARRAPVAYSFILDSLLYFFGICLLLDTLRYICRTLPGVKTIAGVPMEAERVAADEATITAFSDELEGMIEDVPAVMIFNIDESGYSEWADAHEVRILVPDSHSGS